MASTVEKTEKSKRAYSKSQVQKDYSSPHCPMTDEDVYIYCNGIYAINEIRQGMAKGEISHCVRKGTSKNATIVAQRKYVDIWLDKMFMAQKPVKALGYDIVPVKFYNKQTNVG